MQNNIQIYYLVNQLFISEQQRKENSSGKKKLQIVITYHFFFLLLPSQTMTEITQGFKIMLRNNTHGRRQTRRKGLMNMGSVVVIIVVLVVVII